MVTQFDERKVEEVARERSLVGLIERGNHKPPFSREVWSHFLGLDGGRGQMIGEHTPGYERAYAEAVKYLLDLGVLTTADDGSYTILDSHNHLIGSRTPNDELLYFVNKKDAEQYASLFWRGARVRRLSSD